MTVGSTDPLPMIIEDSSPALQIDVLVNSTISVATTIEYSAALNDTASPEYATHSQIIRNIFQSDLEAVAKTTGMMLESITIAFSQSTSQRNRRSISTDVTITAVYAITVSQSTDVYSFEDSVLSSTTSAASNAILNSDGLYMSTNAVASVSSTARFAIDLNAAPIEVSQVPGIIHLILNCIKYRLIYLALFFYFWANF